MTQPSPPLIEWFFLTPCGRYVVTRYREATEEEAWQRESMNRTIPADRPRYVASLKAQGFAMSLTPPPPPPPPRVMVTNGLHLQDAR